MAQLGRSAGLSGFLDLAREVGLDAYQLAQSVGLSRQALTDPDLPVPVEAMGRMYELAAERTQVDDFALRVAETRRLSHLGTIGLVIREQPTLRKALDAYARYQWLQNDAFAVSVQEFEDHAILRIDGPARARRQAVELVLATTVRMLKAILGETWRPQEVWFTHAAPTRTDSHRRVLGVTPLFEQDFSGVFLSRTDLDTEIPSADPALVRQIAGHLDRLTENRRHPMSEQVRQLIIALLPDGDCRVERVAKTFGIDRRTLHRRLSIEGATYSDLLDQARRELAESLLTGTDRSMQGVADLLGFSSLSAFAHWFRRHFGQSASAFRAENGRAAGARSPEPWVAVV